MPNFLRLEPPAESLTGRYNQIMAQPQPDNSGISSRIKPVPTVLVPINKEVKPEGVITYNGGEIDLGKVYG